MFIMRNFPKKFPYFNSESDWHSFSYSRLIVGFFVLLKNSPTSHSFVHSEFREFKFRELIGCEMDNTGFFKHNGVSTTNLMRNFFIP